MRLLDPYAQQLRCRRLWAAVLMQAVFDVVERGSSAAERELYTAYRGEALWWIKSNSNSPASFVWVCEMLGHDPDWIRNRLMAIRHDPMLMKEVRDRLRATGRRRGKPEEQTDARADAQRRGVHRPDAGGVRP